MAAKKPKPKKTPPPKHSRTRLLVFAIIALLSLAALLVSLNLISHETTQAGQLGDEQVYNGENLQHSLDIRLAAKASYPSTPLSLVKDLGVNNGLRSQIVSFGVPVDGLTEYGLLMMPGTPKPAGGYPAIILCHGYVNPADYSTTLGYISDMSFYAHHGFAVIKPDFRGQGLSTGQGTAEGAYFSMAYNTDVMSLISSLKDTDYIDSRNINLWGHSMGAYIALRASVISKDIKNTILLSGPSGSLKDIYLSYVPSSDENNPDALRVRSDIFSKYGTPAENSAFWNNASPSNYLSHLTANVQIHVGLQDSVIPPHLSADLDAALSAAHKHHEYYVYPDGRHGLAAERDFVWSRSLAILKPGS
jgi:dipeptidyl aminopeptidase/acylaminoacyl peptidase